MSNRMSLSNVISGHKVSPARVLLYGPEKIGKTTFAANAPSPIFIGNEDGFGELTSARFPSPQSWAEVRTALDVLDREEHPYKTVVVDTVDWAEPLAIAQVLGGRKSLSDFDFGAGYQALVDEWRLVLGQLDRLRERRGMHVILLGHAQVDTFKNPDGTDFNWYKLTLQKKSSALLKQWADAVLFANFAIVVEQDKKKDKVGKAIGVPARTLFTARRGTFDAGNRYSLPDRLPLEWAAFEFHAFAKKDPAAIVAEITALLERVPDPVAEQARAYMNKLPASDVTKLLALRNKLQAVADEATAAVKSE